MPSPLLVQGPHPLPMANTGSPAAGAAQSVALGSGGRSRRRRCEQMALKKTQEPAARAHIQLASARRATPPPSPWPRRRLATRAGGGPRTSRLATEPSFFSNDLHALGAQLGFLRSRFRPLLRTGPSCVLSTAPERKFQALWFPRKALNFASRPRAPRSPGRDAGGG